MAFEIESGTILTAEQLQNHVKIYAGPAVSTSKLFLYLPIEHLPVNMIQNILNTAFCI